MVDQANLNEPRSRKEAEALGLKISQLGEHLSEDKRKVGETIDKMKSSFQNLSPTYHIRKFPLPAVGVASVLGFITARWLGKSSSSGGEYPPRQPQATFWSALGGQFREELHTAQGILVAAAVRAATRRVVHYFEKPKSNKSEPSAFTRDVP